MVLEPGRVVLAGVMSIDILASEMSVLYHATRMEGHTERANAARTESGKVDVTSQGQ